MRNLSLDGLRGSAIILVILYHHNYLNSGWAGVDLFFVLSGYLITRIIWKARDAGYFWRDFWLKRATRILPPLVVLLCATALLSFDLSAGQTVAYLLSLGDVMAYFRPHQEVLRPLWSLAVEEHFYIFWPFAIRLLSRHTLMYLLCGIILMEPVARGAAIMATRDWQVIYYLTPFRLDGLALGCLLALALESPYWTEWTTRWSGPATLGTIGVWALLRIVMGHAFTRESPTVPYSATCYSLIALSSCLFIAYLLTHKQSIAARILSIKPLVFLGNISYGLYLYHVLLLELLIRDFGFTFHSAILVDVPLSVAIAWLSFRFYESPMIAWGKRSSNRKLINLHG